MEGERELSPPHHPPEQLREIGMEGRDGERKEEGKTKGEGRAALKDHAEELKKEISTYPVLLNFHQVR